MSEELKLCPFCGEKAIVIRTSHGDFRCGCEGNCDLTYPDRDEAIDGWNTRKIEDYLRAELEQTRGELIQTEALLHADCDCDSCPLQDEPACDELCASKGTLITRIAEDRAELARNVELIKRLDALVALYDTWTPLGHTTDWANKFKAARAAVDEMREEGKT